MTVDPLVLVIEDELPIRRFLHTALTGAGFRMLEAGNGFEGLSLIAVQKPAVVILDLGLPDLDGVTIIKRLREWSAIPVIVLSARAQESDKVAALDAGADDYLAKPFGVGELLARLRVALRHAAKADSGTPQEQFSIGELQVDLAHRKVFVATDEVHLTPKEYNLLSVLIQHAGKVLTHRQLLKEVWGAAHTSESHYLRIYMAQLRHKLESDPARPRYLLTEAGVGYRIVAELSEQ